MRSKSQVIEDIVSETDSGTDLEGETEEDITDAQSSAASHHDSAAIPILNSVQRAVEGTLRSKDNKAVTAQRTAASFWISRKLGKRSETRMLAQDKDRLIAKNRSLFAAVTGHAVKHLQPSVNQGEAFLASLSGVEYTTAILARQNYVSQFEDDTFTLLFCSSSISKIYS